MYSIFVHCFVCFCFAVQKMTIDEVHYLCTFCWVVGNSPDFVCYLLLFLLSNLFVFAANATWAMGELFYVGPDQPVSLWDRYAFKDMCCKIRNNYALVHFTVETIRDTLVDGMLPGFCSAATFLCSSCTASGSRSPVQVSLLLMRTRRKNKNTPPPKQQLKVVRLAMTMHDHLETNYKVC